MSEDKDIELLRKYSTLLRGYGNELRELNIKTEEILTKIEKINEKINEHGLEMDNDYEYEYKMKIRESYYKIEDITEDVIRRIIVYAENLDNRADEFALYQPAFSGLFLFDIQEWWNQAYPIIEQIASISGAITGIVAIVTTPITFIKWIRHKLQEKKEKSEYNWIKLILNEDEWNHFILSEKLDLSEDEVKLILKGFGYIWDAKRMLYVATENTYKLRHIKTYNGIRG